MRLDRCKNGHMYDVSRYGENCPYCKSEGLKPEIKEKKLIQLRNQMMMTELQHTGQRIVKQIQQQDGQFVLQELKKGKILEQCQKETFWDVGKVWILGLKEI